MRKVPSELTKQVDFVLCKCFLMVKICGQEFETGNQRLDINVWLMTRMGFRKNIYHWIKSPNWLSNW